MIIFNNVAASNISTANKDISFYSFLLNKTCQLISYAGYNAVVPPIVVQVFLHERSLVIASD